jgi:hypothetical protein
MRLPTSALVLLAVLFVDAARGEEPPGVVAQGLGYIGSILPGRGSRATDCYGEWIIAGATGSSAVVTCRDDDPSCDTQVGPGCVLRAQICVNDAANPRAAGRCTPADVTRFQITSRARDQIDQDNGTAIAVELLFGFEDRIPGLDSRIADGGTITFTPGITQTICTDAFELTVPLKSKRRGFRKGVRKLKTITTGGGKGDRDTVKAVCLPAS